MAQIVPFTDARARFTELLDDVEARHEHVVVTRKGRPAAVVVSPEEWDAIDETLEVLQDEETLDELRESAKDVKADRLFGLEDFGANSGSSELRLTRGAKDRLEALPKAVQEAVLQTLLLIHGEPEKMGKRLVGLAWERMAGLWAARAGSYRILYTIEPHGVLVRAIRHRAVR